MAPEKLALRDKTRHTEGAKSDGFLDIGLEFKLRLFGKTFLIQFFCRKGGPRRLVCNESLSSDPFLSERFSSKQRS
jgi:hypothetical protein